MPVKLERKLKRQAAKDPSIKDKDAYVYGTLRKTGWKPKREKKAEKKMSALLDDLIEFKVEIPGVPGLTYSSSRDPEQRLKDRLEIAGNIAKTAGGVGLATAGAVGAYQLHKHGKGLLTNMRKSFEGMAKTGPALEDLQKAVKEGKTWLKGSDIGTVEEVKDTLDMAHNIATRLKKVPFLARFLGRTIKASDPSKAIEFGKGPAYAKEIEWYGKNAVRDYRVKKMSAAMGKPKYEQETKWYGKRAVQEHRRKMAEQLGFSNMKTPKIFESAEEPIEFAKISVPDKFGREMQHLIDKHALKHRIYDPEKAVEDWHRHLRVQALVADNLAKDRRTMQALKLSSRTKEKPIQFDASILGPWHGSKGHESKIDQLEFPAGLSPAAALQMPLPMLMRLLNQRNLQQQVFSSGDGVTRLNAKLDRLIEFQALENLLGKLGKYAGTAVGAVQKGAGVAGQQLSKLGQAAGSQISRYGSAVGTLARYGQEAGSQVAGAVKRGAGALADTAEMGLRRARAGAFYNRKVAEGTARTAGGIRGYLSRGGAALNAPGPATQAAAGGRGAFFDYLSKNISPGSVAATGVTPMVAKRAAVAPSRIPTTGTSGGGIRGYFERGGSSASGGLNAPIGGTPPPVPPELAASSAAGAAGAGAAAPTQATQATQVAQQAGQQAAAPSTTTISQKVDAALGTGKSWWGRQSSKRKLAYGIGAGTAVGVGGGYLLGRSQDDRNMSAWLDDIITFQDPRPRNPLGEFTGQEGGPDANSMATTYKSGALGTSLATGAAGGIAAGTTGFGIKALLEKLRKAKKK